MGLKSEGKRDIINNSYLYSLQFSKGKKRHYDKVGGDRGKHQSLKIDFCCSAFYHFAVFCAKLHHLFITLLIFLITFLVTYSSNAIYSSSQNSKADKCWLDRYQLDQWQLQLLIPLQMYILVITVYKKRSWQPYRNLILNVYY